jgi:hypothetical protein
MFLKLRLGAYQMFKLFVSLYSSFSPSSLFIFSTRQHDIASDFTAGDKYFLSDGHKVTHSLLWRCAPFS